MDDDDDRIGDRDLEDCYHTNCRFRQLRARP